MRISDWSSDVCSCDLQKRFMGDGAAYAYLAMEQAIADSGLESGEIINERTGLIVGSGGASTRNLIASADIVREKGGPKKIGPFMVTRTMSSTCRSEETTSELKTLMSIADAGLCL